MANLNYWDGSSWVAIGTGGAQGPAGVDGQGIEVFGPQPAAPTPTRKGDHWLESAARRLDENATVVPSPIVIDPVTVRLLPDPVPPVYVCYLD
jgi:hypothetical protein